MRGLTGDLVAHRDNAPVAESGHHGQLPGDHEADEPVLFVEVDPKDVGGSVVRRRVAHVDGVEPAARTHGDHTETQPLFTDGPEAGDGRGVKLFATAGLSTGCRSPLHGPATRRVHPRSRTAPGQVDTLCLRGDLGDAERVHTPPGAEFRRIRR